MTRIEANETRRIEKLCVFCGSSTGSHPAYFEAANQLGRELANAGVTRVFGGGRVGLMGILADSVLAARGQVIGVIPRSLVEKEIALFNVPLSPATPQHAAANRSAKLSSQMSWTMMLAVVYRNRVVGLRPGSIC